MQLQRTIPADHSGRTSDRKLCSPSLLTACPTVIMTTSGNSHKQYTSVQRCKHKAVDLLSSSLSCGHSTNKLLHSVMSLTCNIEDFQYEIQCRTTSKNFTSMCQGHALSSPSLHLHT